MRKKTGDERILLVEKDRKFSSFVCCRPITEYGLVLLTVLLALGQKGGHRHAIMILRTFQTKVQFSYWFGAVRDQII